MEAFHLQSARQCAERAVALESSAPSDVKIPHYYEEAALHLFDVIAEASTEAGARHAPRDIIATAMLATAYSMQSSETMHGIAAGLSTPTPAPAGPGVHPFVEDARLGYIAAAAITPDRLATHDALTTPFVLLSLVARTVRHGAFVADTVYVPRTVWEQAGARIPGYGLKKEAIAHMLPALRRFAASITPGAAVSPETFSRELQIFIDSLGRAREAVKPLVTALEAQLTETKTAAVADAMADLHHHHHLSASSTSLPPTPSASGSASDADVAAIGMTSPVPDTEPTPIKSNSHKPSPSAAPDSSQATAAAGATASSTLTISAPGSVVGSATSGGGMFSFLRGGKTSKESGGSTPLPGGSGTGTSAGGKPPPHPKPSSSGTGSSSVVSGNAGGSDIPVTDDGEDKGGKTSFLRRAIAGISQSVAKTVGNAAAALSVLSVTAGVTLSGAELLAYGGQLVALSEALGDLQAWLQAAIAGSVLERALKEAGGVSGTPSGTGLVFAAEPQLAEYEQTLRKAAVVLAGKQIQPSMLRIVAFLTEFASLVIADLEAIVTRYVSVQADIVRRAEL